MVLLFANVLSLIAFATASLRGLIDQADFQSTIQLALIVAGVFYLLGLVCGQLAQWVIEEQVAAQLTLAKDE